MSKIKTVFVFVSLLTMASAAAQQEISRFELTPFAGYTFGGKFEDMTSGASLELEDDASFGLILNIRQSASNRVPFRSHGFICDKLPSPASCR